ncbi:MAG: glutathione S-transferase [Myxococcota bacterium]
MPDITLHHLDNSRSQRILWLFEELELEYAITEWKRDPKTFRAPPGLRAIHPLGKAPLVQIGDTVLAESGAILESVLERFGEGRLVPTDAEGRERYRFWLHYAEGSLMPPLLLKLVVGQLRSRRIPFFAKPVTRAIADRIDSGFTDAEIDAHFSFVDAHLAKHPYFAGSELSGADIQMSFPLEAGMTRGAGERPHIQAYLARIAERPAYRRALEKGGGFTAMR